MGWSRSLAKLCQRYEQEGLIQGKDVPTTSSTTLERWSSNYNWQARLRERVLADVQEQQFQAQERAARQRANIMTGLEFELGQYMKSLRARQQAAQEDPESPEALRGMITDSSSMERVTKLYLQVAGEPLADRMVIHGDKSQDPVQFDATLDVPDGELLDLLHNTAAVLGELVSGAGQDPKPS